MAQRYPSVELTTLATPGEAVRVGVVSGFFRQHSNWKIPLKGWISQLDRGRFKIFGYHTGLVQDDQTALAAQICDCFIQGPVSIDGWYSQNGCGQHQWIEAARRDAFCTLYREIDTLTKSLHIL
jgi:predicted O-linked N-acetylglucosamine transferase (SPINDLY family)